MTTAIAKALEVQRSKRWREEVIKVLLFACALLSVVTTAGIIIVLLREAILFFREVSIFEFLFGTEWTPVFRDASFGVLPLLCGTFMVVAGSSMPLLRY